MIDKDRDMAIRIHSLLLVCHLIEQCKSNLSDVRVAKVKNRLSRYGSTTLAAHLAYLLEPPAAIKPPCAPLIGNRRPLSGFGTQRVKIKIMSGRGRFFDIYL